MNHSVPDKFPPQSGDPYFSPAQRFPVRAPVDGRRWIRSFVVISSVTVIIYSVATLFLVAWMGDIGVRCILGIRVKEPIAAAYKGQWQGALPQVDDELSSIGTTRIGRYIDYVAALRGLERSVDKVIEVSWWDHQTKKVKSSSVRVGYRPLGTYMMSLIWFAQEMVIFAVGALVY